MKKFLAIICVFALLISTGCSGKSSYNEAPAASSMAIARDAAAAPQAAPGEYGLAGGTTAYDSGDMAEYEVAEEAEMDDDSYDSAAASPEQQQVPDGRKIVKTVNMALQTVTFDSGVAEIDRLAKSFGGYVQDSYVEGRDLYNERGARSAQFTVRVPADKLDGFVSSLGDSQFNLVSKSQSEEDISFNYYDSKARLSSLQTQEKRLLAMLEKADELKYMLQVEQELANVRYQIESMQSQLGRMDNSVNLSTVYLQLVEVVKYEPVEDVPITFTQRIWRAFESSWDDFGDGMQDFAVAMIYLIPTFFVLAVIVGIILAIVFSARRSSKRKKAARAATALATTQQAVVQPPAPPTPPTEEEK